MSAQEPRPFCVDCHLQSSALVMQCDCINMLGGKTSSSVNLSKHIHCFISRNLAPRSVEFALDVLTNSL